METNNTKQTGNEHVSSSVNPSGCTPEGALAAAEKLRSIADRIEQFVTQQITRLEAASLQHAAPQPRSDFAPEGDNVEIEQQRRKWEQERDAEIRRLRDEGQLLKDAWEQIESEQRRLLAERGSMRAASGPPVSSSRQATVAQPISKPESSPELAPKTDHKPASPNTSREQAVRQFQHLKREIGKHNRGNR